MAPGNHPDISHFYDGWHVAKGTCIINVVHNKHMIKWSFPLTGLRKKLEALSKQKDCGIVGRWLKSLINHLYWSVASTPGGDQALMKAKWLSVDNHIHNVHQGHSSNFPKCLHGDLHGHEANKEWFKRCK